MFKKKKELPQGMESFDTLVGKSSQIHGRMTVHDSIRIDGKIFGNLEPADGQICCIAVGPTGVVTGNIHCHRAYIAGTISGNIYAKELIILSDSAIVRGDIKSQSFNIASGAVVDGAMFQANPNLRDPQQSHAVQTSLFNEPNSPDRSKQ